MPPRAARDASAQRLGGDGTSDAAKPDDEKSSATDAAYRLLHRQGAPQALLDGPAIGRDSLVPVIAPIDHGNGEDGR